MEKVALRLFQAANGHVRVRPSTARPGKSQGESITCHQFPQSCPREGHCPGLCLNETGRGMSHRNPAGALLKTPRQSREQRVGNGPLQAVRGWPCEPGMERAAGAYSVSLPTTQDHVHEPGSGRQGTL